MKPFCHWQCHVSADMSSTCVVQHPYIGTHGYKFWMGIQSCSFYWNWARIGEATRCQWVVLFHTRPCFKFTTLSPLSHKYLVPYDRYFKSKLNEYIIENFEWGLNIQFREHCATWVKTMFSQIITQILLYCDNSYINRCGFSMPTKRFYFRWKRVGTGDNILQIL